MCIQPLKNIVSIFRVNQIHTKLNSPATVISGSPVSTQYGRNLLSPKQANTTLILAFGLASIGLATGALHWSKCGFNIVWQKLHSNFFVNERIPQASQSQQKKLAFSFLKRLKQLLDSLFLLSNPYMVMISIPSLWRFHVVLACCGIQNLRTRQ